MIDDTLKRFENVHTSLRKKLDSDPAQAIEEARTLDTSVGLSMTNINLLKGMTFIDAGEELNDNGIITEGIELLRLELTQTPDRVDIRYSLANGLVASANTSTYSSPTWYCETATIRREAREHYRIAAQLGPNGNLKTRALTNLGNALNTAHRRVEAYDYYSKALTLDPENGVALIGAAKILIHFLNEGIGDQATLTRVAAHHLKLARDNPDRIRELVGERGFEPLSKYFNALDEVKPTEAPAPRNGYERFVATHRLALSPTIEGVDIGLKYWDSLQITRVTEKLTRSENEPFCVPQIFAMFNVLKSDYLAARHLAYTAIEGEVRDSGKYSDTLDYATYGIRPSLLNLAQRSCIDILDKVAVAATEYLDLPGKAREIYFRSRWFSKEQRPKRTEWISGVLKEINENNTALIAITEVALDIANDGFLQRYKLLRDASTHRFIVLHDFGEVPLAKGDRVQHAHETEFIDSLLDTLKLVRAVLFYFVEMVNQRELRADESGELRGQLYVPDHDWIRGAQD